MMNYVRRSYFKNSKPQNLLPRMPIRRDKVLKKMMRNRGAIKYMYAPSGYGKSSVAYDYVDYNHNWQNVFWFNCQSACFKRDVETGELFDKMLECCETPNVVVFDDLIELRGKTKKEFTHIIGLLMDMDCDIVVTQNSICCMPTPLNFDTTFVFGVDLCISESEARAVKIYGTYEGFNFQYSTICQCPACLIFSKTGEEDLLLCPRSKNTSNLETAILFLVYTLKSDFMFTLERFIDKDKLYEEMPIIASKYPHIGYRPETDSFETINVKKSLIADTFKPLIEDIVDASKFDTAHELIDAIMDLMCELEDVEQAYEFVETFGDIEDIKSFATHEFSHMLKNCNFSLVYNILDKIERSRITDNLIVDFYKSCLFGYIRDKNRFQELMQNIRKHEDRGSCLYVPYRLMSYAYMFEEFSEEKLDELLQLMSDDAYQNSDLYKDASLQFDIDACLWLTRYLKASIKSPIESLEMLGEAVLDLNVGENIDEKIQKLTRRYNCDISGICLGYVFMCNNMLKQARLGESFEESFRDYFGEENAEYGIRLFEKITKLIVTLYDERAYIVNVPWQLVDALLRMEDLWGSYKDASECLDNISIIDVMFSVDSFSEEQAKLEKAIQNSIKRHLANGETHLKKGGSRCVLASNYDVACKNVEISIFNRPTLSIDGKEIQLSKFSTKKGRFILALLAIANYREVHRDELIKDLFPPDRSNNRCTLSNFYSIVSQLKNEFMKHGVDDCIIKNPLGYKINPDIVKTDYEAFDILVNDYMFNVGCTDSWEEPYSRLKDRFAYPAFDSLNGNVTIANYRMHSRDRLVDALLSATCRLIEQEDSFGALTLSRQALELDNKREDVYAALMRSQSLAEQRSQAIETFFQCKKYLSNELGVAPSKSLIDEYEKLIV